MSSPGSNTYRLFHLEDGVPTDVYSLDEAVAEGIWSLHGRWTCR
jgi:type I site-specific restriction endonuclease